ncbi:MAG: hypothetical protein GTN57_02700 [Acidobacteria bacterium]|nr:hypothetical protein [Acidobacteriota bacterium]NIT10023.1 hypothetical protein [Acidobacteriota bacterium]
MRRVGSAICGLILCAVLTSLPVLLQPEFDVAAHLPVEPGLPAEADEPIDPKIDERNEDKGYRSSILVGSTPRNATLFLRLQLPHARRCDDPHGSRIHGLRAPPA